MYDLDETEEIIEAAVKNIQEGNEKLREARDKVIIGAHESRVFFTKTPKIHIVDSTFKVLIRGFMASMIIVRLSVSVKINPYK